MSIGRGFEVVKLEYIVYPGPRAVDIAILILYQEILAIYTPTALSTDTFTEM